MSVAWTRTMAFQRSYTDVYKYLSDRLAAALEVILAERINVFP